MPRLQESPAIRALNAALDVFPGLRRDRLVDVTPATRHTSGLAIDIFFNAKSATEKQRALELVEVLVMHHKAMKWSDLIFTDFHIGGGLGGYMGDGHTHYPWTGGRHDDHIHLDWVDLKLTTGPKGSPEFIRNPYEWSALAQKTDWRAALETDLRALSSSWSSGTPGPSASPLPSWLAGWWRVVQEGTDYYYLAQADGSVAWTYDAPRGQGGGTVTDPRNRGRCAIESNGELTVTWNEVGGMSTIETFQRLTPTSLKGRSNRGGPLTMTRLA